MEKTYPSALKHVFKYEGGYVDHPLDPGGATNMGITRRTLARYRRRDVDKSDVRLLSIEEAGDIYRKLYWEPCHCDVIPSGIDFALFDCAVNQGVSRAIRILQKSVHVKVDAILGPQTLAAIAVNPPKELLNEFIARRMNHYGRLASLFRTFGLGWSRRLSDVHAQALHLLNTSSQK